MSENKKKTLWDTITIDIQQRQEVLDALSCFCPSETPPRLVWHLQPRRDKAYTVVFASNDSTQLSIVEWRPDMNGEWKKVCSHADYHELLSDLEHVHFPKFIPADSPEAAGFSTKHSPH